MSDEEKQNFFEKEAHESDEDRVIDSSEEEEDDDEEELAKIRDGFIVDGDEEDEDDEDGDDDDDKVRKRGHKSKKKREKPMDDALDEDDLDLVMENTGAAPRAEKSTYKRLKKRKTDTEESDTSSGRARGAGNALDDIFSDVEEDEDDEVESGTRAGAQGSDDEDLDEVETDRHRRDHHGRRDADDMDDFIEEDSDDEDEDTRSSRKSKAPRAPIMPQLGDNINQEKLDQLFEIFGDGYDYEWALELEDQEGEMDSDEEGAGHDGEPGSTKLTDIFEKTELQERMLTEEDNEIRVTDVPERYQELRKNIRGYKLSQPDFEFEKQWVADTLASEKQNFFEQYTNNGMLEEIKNAFKSAVDDVLTFICEDLLEVPFIYTHRKDFINYAKMDGERLELIELLDEDDLWRIVQLDVEFHSLLGKKKVVERLLNKLDKLQDHNNSIEHLKKTQDFQDYYDYIVFKYSRELKKLTKNGVLTTAEDDLDEVDEDDYDPDAAEEVNVNSSSQKDKNGTKVSKKPSKHATWDRIRDSELYKMVNMIGISAEQVGENVAATTKVNFASDPDSDPDTILQDICSENQVAYPNVKLAGSIVQKMFAEELFHEPKIRSLVRTAFSNYGEVNVKLTEKGRVKISKDSAYYDFKYLIKRSVSSFTAYEPSLFLRMLAAEQDNLIQIQIQLESKDEFIRHIFEQYVSSDNQSEIAQKWNEIRSKSLQLAVSKLFPIVAMHVKEELRKDCETLLFKEVRHGVLKRIDQAPYCPPGFSKGTVPEALVLSCGEGNFGSDAVVGIFMDSEGVAKDFFKFSSNPIRDAEFADSFVAKFQEWRPDVVGISGYNANTKKLLDVVRGIVEKEGLRPEKHPEADYSQYPDNRPPIAQVIFVKDEVARLYQNSERAKTEFPDKPQLQRYCIALARYLQSPLLEYINLNEDIVAILFHENQGLLGLDLLKFAIDTAFVDIVNLVGVDINHAIRNSYYASCVQYVAGLGPRKASGLLQTIQTKASSGLMSRASLVTLQIMAKNIFMNCASFLKIYGNQNNSKYMDEADVLDETRIHPEDYVLATKIVADALDLDEEDVEDLESRPGEGVVRKLDEGNNLAKLNNLILEDYAKELETRHGKKKKSTLYMIKDELQNHYEDVRRRFHILDAKEIFSCLTGETTDTFYPGAVVTIVLKRISPRFLSGVTQFLVSCNVKSDYMFEYNENRNVDEKFHVQQAVQAKILSVDYEDFKCEASLLKKDIRNAESRKIKRSPQEWDSIAEEEDERRERMKLERETKPKKFIKHPYFHNFNSKQAEEYLATLQRGDLVIRPSSLGSSHLAITWKVDNNLYQHLDVVERVGTTQKGEEKKIYILKKKRFSDLDELITFYIYKVAKNVESMVSHDKFYNKSRAETEAYLDSYLKANQGRGSYIFCFDHRYPGWFTLLFKGSEKSKIHSMPVEVTPDGYRIAGYDYATVALLTNGFKKIMASRKQGKIRNNY